MLITIADLVWKNNRGTKTTYILAVLVAGQCCSRNMQPGPALGGLCIQTEPSLFAKSGSYWLRLFGLAFLRETLALAVFRVSPPSQIRL